MSTSEKAVKYIKEYLSGKLAKPLFVVVNITADYLCIKNAIREMLETKRLSDFCANPDNIPDCDSFVNYIKTIKGNVAVFGVGEHISFFDCDLINRLKDITLSGGKAVILCRFINSKFSRLKNDPRFRDGQYYEVLGDETIPIVTAIADGLNLLNILKGYKSLLNCLENGEKNNLVVSTSQKLPVNTIKTAYECIKFIDDTFNISENFGGEIEWTSLLNEIVKKGNVKGILSELGETNFEDFISQTGYRLFKLFLALKQKENLPRYLKFALSKTTSYIDIKRNVIFSILELNRLDSDFNAYYAERKKYLSKFSEADLAAFVSEAKIKDKDRLYYLTDVTLIERQAIIECLSTSEYDFETLRKIYPDLYAYIDNYEFRIADMGDRITQYFNQYKKLKVTNTISDDFKSLVIGNARSPRKYNLLPTRNSIFDRIDKKNTTLFFIDAMGVEFISYIKDYATHNGLSITVHIAIANLPSITKINKDFFNEWIGKKYEIKDLDKLKHSGENGFDYTQTKLPIHLARELDIIKEALERAKTELFARSSDKAIFSSDHGASRLCVLNGQELSYETDNKGEYSGRCCAYSSSFIIENATEENDYLVLADYGRFKGSRAAQVEVHGGATWEEILIPIIELKLKNDVIEIKLVESEITASFRKKPTITLFSTSKLLDVSIVLNGKTYYAENIGENKHKVVFDNLQAKTYEADVFAGDNYCGKIMFVVKKESGGEKDLF